MAYESRSSAKPHILMFPWFAIGHITPYLHLANKLAERGYKTSFLLPNKAKLMVQHLNLHPHLITFHSLSVPHVDGLPLGSETTNDSGMHLSPLIAVAQDLTRPQVEQAILDLKPDFAFYDTAYWVPDITAKLGIKSVSYNIVSAAGIAIGLVPACSESYHIGHNGEVPPRLMKTEELRVPPPGYPSETVVLRKHEVDNVKKMVCHEFGRGITFGWRVHASLKSGDAIALRTCREMEGQFCDYLGSQFGKPILLTGPVLPDSANADSAALEERWASWLGRHKPGSVVYCAFGSEFVLDKEQFKEILLGLEMSGYPFFAALKPPRGCSTVEEAMPEGLEGRGMVHGGWVQQPLLLKHPSVGCFVSHCGFGSLWESLLSSQQIVLLPQLGDHILNTRMMTEDLKVAVEVEKEESGWVPRERVCRAVKEVMDEGSQVGSFIRENHARWREALGARSSIIPAYVDSFVEKLSQI